MYGTAKPKLDARLQGMISASATVGFSEHEFLIPFNSMFNGIQIYAWDSNVFDNIKLESQYNIGTPESPIWKRYKKFGKSWFIFPNHHIEIVLFPSDFKMGGRLLFTYDNKGPSSVNFAINGYTFVDQIKINPSLAEEGEDW